MKIAIKLVAFLTILSIVSCDKWNDHHEGTDALNSLSGIWVIDTLKYYKGSDDTLIVYESVFDTSHNYYIAINETLNYRNKKLLCTSNLFNSNSQFFLDIDWTFAWGTNDNIDLSNKLNFIDCETCNNSDTFYRYLQGMFIVKHIKRNQSILLIQTRVNYDYTEIINIFLTKIK